MYTKEEMKVRDARLEVEAPVANLAHALDVPFYSLVKHEDNYDAAPDGALGVIFPGRGRVVVVRFYRNTDGRMAYTNAFMGYGSGKQEEIIEACRFASYAISAVREGKVIA